MINKMMENDLLEDDEVILEADTDDEFEHASKKRKRGDSKGKSKQRARAESSRPATRQSSVAAAGRSVTEKSGFVDGELSSQRVSVAIPTRPMSTRISTTSLTATTTSWSIIASTRGMLRSSRSSRERISSRTTSTSASSPSALTRSRSG
jgi:hypothetical protein